MTVAIGIDVGGTQIRVAAVEDGNIIARRWSATADGDTSPAALITRIASMVKRVAKDVDFSVSDIGLAMPGPTNGDRGIVYSLPNIKGWEREIHVLNLMRVHFPHVRIVIDNDANAATVGEHRFGKGQGTKDFVYLTVSTGIGGGAIIDGKLQRGAHGAAAELGHMTIDMNGPLCNCGNIGCLETLASGTAIARLGQEFNFTTAKDVAEAAMAGSVAATDILRRVGTTLGYGLVNIAHVYDPDMIVLGGGVMKAPLVYDVAGSVLRNNAMHAVYNVPLHVSVLGDDIGLLGAAALVS